jgi:hypothetical protein
MLKAEPALIPSRPHSHWPVGARLHFKRGGALAPRHQALSGTAVLVLSELKLVGPSGPSQSYSWRQEVLAMALGGKLGLARPDQLELPVDGDDPELPYVAQRDGLGQNAPR